MAVKLNKNFDQSKAIKNLARGYKLVPHIDRFLPTWDEQGFTFQSQKKQPDDAWHPSGHCLPSMHSLYHIALDHPQETKHAPSSIKNFQVGHFWHQWLQWIVVEKLGFAEWDAVERRGLEGWYPILDQTRKVHGLDIPWAPWHWVTGAGDIAPCVIPEHGEYIVDFKTMNARSHKMAAGDSLELRLAESWECQVNIYMDFFDQERALIIGICKDTPHDMIEIEFKRNQPLIDALYDKWELVSGCITDRHEPDENLVYPLPLRGISS
jgi:hypothetical protein